MYKPDKQKNVLYEFGYFKLHTFILCTIDTFIEQFMFGWISRDNCCLKFTQKGVDKHVFFLLTKNVCKVLSFCAFLSEFFVEKIHL